MNGQHRIRSLSPPQPEEVHVWIAIGNCPTFVLEAFQETLSLQELCRARRFRFDRHRMRYIFSRGVLRAILAQYLRCEPKDLDFQFNEFGKPHLSKAISPVPELTFNVSHSEDLVILATAVNRSIGVDSEFVRPVEDFERIAHLYFTNAERALIQAASDNKKEHVFLSYWTRKEAYVKAVGKGLSIPLNSFETTIPIGMCGIRMPVARDSQKVAWWLTDLEMPRGYVGSLVVEGAAPRIKYLEWHHNKMMPPDKRP